MVKRFSPGAPLEVFEKWFLGAPPARWTGVIMSVTLIKYHKTLNLENPKTSNGSLNNEYLLH